MGLRVLQHKYICFFVFFFQVIIIKSYISIKGGGGVHFRGSNTFAICVLLLPYTKSYTSRKKQH